MEPCQYRSQRRVQALTTSFLLLVVLPRGIAFLAHRLSPHLNAMGIVHQAIEDAIGDGRIGDLLVPARDRQPGAPWPALSGAGGASRSFRDVEIRSKVAFCAKGVSFSRSLVILSEAKDLCISGGSSGPRTRPRFEAALSEVE